MRIFLFLFFLLISTVEAANRLPYLVFLKSGTILTRLTDREERQLSKGVYAKVLETNLNKRDHFIVYNKEGKAIYETSSLGILEIEKDIRILPNVDAEVIFPPQDKFKTNDKYILFDSQFNLHIENLKIGILDPLYSQNISSTIGPRYEFRTLYKSGLAVNFGIDVNYQPVEWSNDFGETTKLTIFSFGPQIERVIYNEDEFTLSILFSGEFAPIYKTKAGDFTDEYKAMLYDVGAEFIWSTQHGKWSFGTHFRHHDLILLSTNRAELNPIPEEISLSSVGAMVGYKYEWEL
jgi:hypothetical protein